MCQDSEAITYMTSLCSRIHILTLGLELRANDFFFLKDGADMSVDMTAAERCKVPPYFSTVWRGRERMEGRMNKDADSRLDDCCDSEEQSKDTIRWRNR